MSDVKASPNKYSYVLDKSIKVRVITRSYFLLKRSCLDVLYLLQYDRK